MSRSYINYIDVNIVKKVLHLYNLDTVDAVISYEYMECCYTVSYKGTSDRYIVACEDSTIKAETFSNVKYVFVVCKDCTSVVRFRMDEVITEFILIRVAYDKIKLMCPRDITVEDTVFKIEEIKLPCEETNEF